MKKTFFLMYVVFLTISLGGQVPYAFTWESRHIGDDYSSSYISSVKDQIVQGPCGVFAAIAAVEAMAQIYYNNGTLDIFDFSEAYVYNNNCLGIGCQSAPPADVLNFAKSTGLINDNCFRFPEQWFDIDTCIDCSTYCNFPSQRIYLPNMTAWEISLASDSALKQAILDYGPIIMMPAVSNGCSLHSSDPNCNFPHTILLIGWSGTSWHIKDSWPDSSYVGYRNYSEFNYQPHFYRVYPVNPQNSSDVLRCSGEQSELFNRKAFDRDGDGFYNWGLDSYPKPASCNGPDLMDFNDGNPDYIFRVGDLVMTTPVLSGPTGLVCPSGGQFSLSYVPEGFSCTWSISKNAYCFASPTSGTGSTANVYPNNSCIGKESEITFTISHNGTASYKKSFYVNCPREDLMSYSVLDSYGATPPKYGDTYYLCPYTIYHIYFNENDPGCSISDLNWLLPTGWSEYYRYNNMISLIPMILLMAFSVLRRKQAAPLQIELLS
jgi:hypothetical protein